MKAIEIIYNKIDELNSDMKHEPDFERKFVYALKIKQLIKIIEEMDVLQSGASIYKQLDIDRSSEMAEIIMEEKGYI